MSDFIHNVPIKVPNKSGFDMSFENAFTGKCGQLLPVVCQELLPNDTVSLGANFQVQLPPMVSDFFGRIDFILEAFFVPNRLCWHGWSTFATHPTASPMYPVGYPDVNKVINTPHFNLSSFAPTSQDQISQFKDLVLTYFGPTSLADYLDAKIDVNDLSDLLDQRAVPLGSFSLLPFIAYARIYDDWYRDSRIQSPLFYSPAGQAGALNSMGASVLPFTDNFLNFSETSGVDFSNSFDLFVESGPSIVVNSRARYGGVGNGDIFTVRQRNWAKDYFTSASTQPQASIVASKIDFSTAGENSSISIAAIRAANSLQQWSERMNLAGYRYADQIYAQFGIYPSDAIMDRPLYLGRVKQPVYTRSVFQQTPSDSSTNPLGGKVGTKFGSSQVVGDGSLIQSFTASEHGFLIVLASLVPRAYYATGVNRKFRRIKIGDYAFPLLANMGDQSIQMYELGLYGTGENDTFGYTDMYAEYKLNNDQIHGLLRDDGNLKQFALQRSFGSSTESPTGINSAFITIPTDYLDQVLQVSTEELGCTYWADVYFSFKKISTLPVYSQPTLMDLQNAHVESIPRGGNRL